MSLRQVLKESRSRPHPSVSIKREREQDQRLGEPHRPSPSAAHHEQDPGCICPCVSPIPPKGSFPTIRSLP